MRAGSDQIGGSGSGTPVVIDLGTYRHSEPELSASPSPRPGLTRRPRRRRSGVVALAIAVTVMVDGGAAPEPPELVRLFTVPDTASLSAHGGSYTAGAGRLYVATEDDRHFTVTAYRLSDGGVDWEVPGRLRWPDLPRARTGSTELHLVGGVVLLSEGDHVTGYDPTTGAMVWSREGWPVLRTQEQVLLYRNGSDKRPAKVTAVDLHTGQGRGAPLTRAAPGAVVDSETIEYVAGLGRGPGGTRYLYTMRFSDGELNRYELGAGADPLPARVDVTADLDFMPAVRTVGDVALVGNLGSEPPYVGAFDPLTLEPHWTATGSGIIEPCGPVMCQAGYAAVEPRWRLRGLDPATGTVRWELRCADAAVGEGCRMSPAVLPSGDILVQVVTADEDAGDEDSVPRPRTKSWIVDARSGQRQGAEVDGWTASPSAVFGAVFTRTEEKAGAEPGAGARTWYAVPGRHPAGVRVVGSLAGPASCRPVGRQLVCHRDGQDLTVWRIER